MERRELKSNEAGFLKSNLPIKGVRELIQKFKGRYVEEVECLFTYVIYEFDTSEDVKQFKQELNRIVDLD